MFGVVEAIAPISKDRPRIGMEGHFEVSSGETPLRILVDEED